VRRLIAAGLAGAVVAALIFVAVLYVADLEIAERDGDGESSSAVTDPDLRGEPAGEARAEVEALGLEARVVGEPTNYQSAFEAASDEIVRQTPPAGSEVPPDATVTLDAGG
jgi:hypothetical protein